MVRSAEKPASGRIIVERYTWLERVTHLVHLVAMLTLLITGFKIYFGWDFMEFSYSSDPAYDCCAFFPGRKLDSGPLQSFFLQRRKMQCQRPDSAFQGILHVWKR